MMHGQLRLPPAHRHEKQGLITPGRSASFLRPGHLITTLERESSFATTTSPRGRLPAATGRSSVPPGWNEAHWELSRRQTTPQLVEQIAPEREDLPWPLSRSVAKRVPREAAWYHSWQARSLY